MPSDPLLHRHRRRRNLSLPSSKTHQNATTTKKKVVFAEASRRAGRTVDRVVSIMDAAGLRLSQLTGFATRVLRAVAAMDSNNYPEVLDHIFIVNSSAAFQAIWRVVRVFVDAGTRDKVRVLGGGDAMLSALLQEFDAAQVPSFLGGALDFDERRRQWLEVMDAAMAEAAAAAEGGGAGGGGQKSPARPAGSGSGAAAAAAAAGNGHAAAAAAGAAGAAVALPRIRTSTSDGGGGAAAGASDSDDGDGGADGFATPLSRVSAVSSAVSLYFDAVEAAAPAAGRSISPGGGSGGGGGGSPAGSPRVRGGVDAAMPNWSPQHQHHSTAHADGAPRLPAVPSGELPDGTGPEGARCCVIS